MMIQDKARGCGRDPVWPERGHTMNERIRRIVRGDRGDPRVWRRWTLGAGALATLMAVGAAIGQPRDAAPAGRPEQVRRQERPDQPGPAVAARRNVLNRLLEQLRGQLRETDRVLAERPGATGEEADLLRAEQAALREQIERTEMQLGNLDRGRRGAQPEAQMARQERAAAQAARAERLEGLRRRAAEIQGRLQGLEDQEGDQARALREELNGVRAQITAAELQVQQSQRVQAERPLRTPVRDGAPSTVRRAPEADRGLEMQVAELRGQVDGLRQKVDRMELALAKLLSRRPAGDGQPTLPPQF